MASSLKTRVTVHLNRCVVSGQISNELRVTVKLRGAADSADESLKVHHYQRHQHIDHFRHFYHKRLIVAASVT